MSFDITKIFLNDNSKITPKDAAAAIVVDDDLKVLLQLRDNIEAIFFPNHWGFFGGAIEKNETPQLAVLRELREELGIDFSIEQVDYLISTELGFKKNSRLIKRLFFVVKINKVQSKKITVVEGQKGSFFTKDESLSIPNFAPYDRFALWVFWNQQRLNVDF